MANPRLSLRMSRIRLSRGLIVKKGVRMDHVYCVILIPVNSTDPLHTAFQACKLFYPYTFLPN